VAVNGASYEGAGGFGFSFAHRFANSSIPLYVSGAYGTGGSHEQVGRLGFAVEW
jgi:hypothetical protein